MNRQDLDELLTPGSKWTMKDIITRVEAWMMFVFTNFDAFETNLSILEPPGLTISRFRSFGRFYLTHRVSFQNIQPDDEQMRQLAIEQFVHAVITEEQPAESEMKRPERRLKY